MNQTFSEASLDANWDTGGTPDTWDRTDRGLGGSPRDA